MGKTNAVQRENHERVRTPSFCVNEREKKECGSLEEFAEAQNSILLNGEISHDGNAAATVKGALTHVKTER